MGNVGPGLKGPRKLLTWPCEIPTSRLASSSLSTCERQCGPAQASHPPSAIVEGPIRGPGNDRVKFGCIHLVASGRSGRTILGT